MVKCFDSLGSLSFNISETSPQSSRSLPEESAEHRRILTRLPARIWFLTWGAGAAAGEMKGTPFGTTRTADPRVSVQHDDEWGGGGGGGGPGGGGFFWGRFFFFPKKKKIF